MTFEWDEEKDRINSEKHGLTFEQAQQAFFDPHRVILEDKRHSADEQRFFCIGLVEGLVATVRYTIREDRIRVFGAGYWRVGKRLYYGEEL
ncbi:MAG: BrnT family toxin [Spirochaetia bacterium]